MRVALLFALLAATGCGLSIPELTGGDRDRDVLDEVDGLDELDVADPDPAGDLDPESADPDPNADGDDLDETEGAGDDDTDDTDADPTDDADPPADTDDADPDVFDPADITDIGPDTDDEPEPEPADEEEATEPDDDLDPADPDPTDGADPDPADDAPGDDLDLEPGDDTDTPPAAGTVRDFGTAGRYVYIPAGSYDQGCSPGDTYCKAGGGETTVRRVTISRSLWFKEAEVTQGEWKAVSGGVNPSCFQSVFGSVCGTSNANDAGPLENVDWYSTLAYANALSALDGLTACYTLAGCADPANGWLDGVHTGCTGATFAGLGSCTGYRLPTEAEWEYAARAGTTTATYGGNLSAESGCVTLSGAGGVAAGTAFGDLAWYDCNAGSRSQAVRQKRANPWGLYDVSGNLLEWVWDNWSAAAYQGGAATDPITSIGGSAERVLRGGSWNTGAGSARVSYRSYGLAAARGNTTGFRLVRLAEAGTGGDADPDPDAEPEGDAETPAAGTPRDFVGAGRYVYIPAGSYDQGCSSGDAYCAGNESPARRVTIVRGYWMKETEVTQGEWKALSGGVNPSAASTCGDDCPVELMDWYSALSYANALSGGAGLTPCYTLAGCADPANGWKDGVHTGCTDATYAGPGGCTGYRLPTEAEWEYAARAGTTTATYGGNLSGTVGCVTVSGGGGTAAGTPLADLAWYKCNAVDRPQRTRGKRPNPWGLYDVLGNVWEWTWDGYAEAAYGGGAAVDPAIDAGTYRVRRGGSWSGDFVANLRVGARGNSAPGNRNSDIGFRLVRLAEAGTGGDADPDPEPEPEPEPDEPACTCSAITTCCDGCRARRTGQACDDGVARTGNDTCRASGECEGTPCACVGVNTCCDGCFARNAGNLCDDGLYCTTGDTCTIGGDCAGAPRDCTSVVPWPLCRATTCDESADRCAAGAAINEAGACDDGNPGTGADRCTAGTCLGSLCQCVGTNACCNGCFVVNGSEGAPCNDGFGNTIVDVCLGGECTGYGPGVGVRDFGTAGRYVYIPAGSFDQGCSSGDAYCGADESPVRRVTISRGFWIKATEVSQGEWKAVTGGPNPSYFQNTTCTNTNCASTENANDTGPLEGVDWYSALAFANALSARDGLTACYTLAGCTNAANGWYDGTHEGCTGATFSGPGACTGYRLPTEAEWEYAARAGVTTATYGGHLTTDTGCVNVSGAAGVSPGTPLAELGWYLCNGGGRTRAVGGKRPNPWGLYDTVGNVWEWVWDSYSATGYSGGAVTDPASGAAGAERVLRGGSWFNGPLSQRVSERSKNAVDLRFATVGLRLVRQP